MCLARVAAIGAMRLRLASAIAVATLMVSVTSSAVVDPSSSSCPAPSPAKATRNPRAISSFPRIYLIDGFLSGSEVAHVRKLGEELHDFHDRKGTPQDIGSYRQEYLLPHHYESIVADEVVAKLEDRISAYSHLPRDTEMRPKMALAVRNATSAGFHDVHHDHNFAALTLQELAAEGKKVPLIELQASMLGYLGSVEKGGETIFPCVCDRKDPLCAKAQKACKYLYVNGVFSANTTGHGQPYKEADEVTLDKIRRASEFLAERSQALCNDKSQPGLRVSPRAGRAVIIYGNNVRGDADPRSWYGSCNVVKGQKLSWQRFLYAPQYEEETGVHAVAHFEWNDIEL